MLSIILLSLLGVVQATTTTVTQTVTVTSTVYYSTPAPSCTTSVTLSFDDLTCSNRCTLPATYHSFVFPSGDWQVVNKAALPTSNNEDLAVTSQPNALMSEGPASFGSTGQGFTFNFTRFEWSVFTTDGAPMATFFMNGTTATGEHRSYNVTVNNGINIAPYMLDMTSPQGQAEGFSDLVELTFAAYSEYYSTPPQTNVPSILIFDDIELAVNVGPSF